MNKKYSEYIILYLFPWTLFLCKINNIVINVRKRAIVVLIHERMFLIVDRFFIHVFTSENSTLLKRLVIFDKLAACGLLQYNSNSILPGVVWCSFHIKVAKSVIH